MSTELAENAIIGAASECSTLLLKRNKDCLIWEACTKLLQQKLNFSPLMLSVILLASVYLTLGEEYNEQMNDLTRSRKLSLQLSQKERMLTFPVVFHENLTDFLPYKVMYLIDLVKVYYCQYITTHENSSKF